MSAYIVARLEARLAGSPADLYRLGFGEPADNTAIVLDAKVAIEEASRDRGGALALVRGAASLPAVAVIAHRLAHQYAAVAFFDPKLSGYVVALSHGGPEIGTLIPAGSVVGAAGVAP